MKNKIKNKLFINDKNEDKRNVKIDVKILYYNYLNYKGNKAEKLVFNYLAQLSYGELQSARYYVRNDRSIDDDLFKIIFDLYKIK